MRNMPFQRGIGKLFPVLFFLVCPVGVVPGHAVGDAGPRLTLRHDGAVRSYMVRMPPAAVPSGKKLALVLVLHGGGGNADITERMTGFTEKGRVGGFIVVYPEGSSRFGDKLLTWNADHCCGYAMQNRIDDVGFINALLDRLLRDYPADPRRIYVTGISNGGMMSHRLGIELPHRIAAIAPVAAALFGDEKPPAHPVSALIINGMLDKSVPYLGGAPGGRFPGAWDGAPVKPVLAQAEFWAQANRCPDTPLSQDRGAVVRWQYHCAAGKAVVLHLLKDTGHSWPGGQRGFRGADDPGSTLNATDVIWEFFRMHVK